MVSSAIRIFLVIELLCSVFSCTSAAQCVPPPTGQNCCNDMGTSVCRELPQMGDLVLGTKTLFVTGEHNVGRIRLQDAQNMGDIERLILTGLGITGIEPGALNDLKLTDLDLSNNQLSSLDLASMPGSLRTIDLSSNQINSIDFGEQTHLPNLRFMNLSGNAIQFVADGFFNVFRKPVPAGQISSSGDIVTYDQANSEIVPDLDLRNNQWDCNYCTVHVVGRYLLSKVSYVEICSNSDPPKSMFCVRCSDNRRFVAEILSPVAPCNQATKAQMVGIIVVVVILILALLILGTLLLYRRLNRGKNKPDEDTEEAAEGVEQSAKQSAQQPAVNTRPQQPTTGKRPEQPTDGTKPRRVVNAFSSNNNPAQPEQINPEFKPSHEKPPNSDSDTLPRFLPARNSRPSSAAGNSWVDEEAHEGYQNPVYEQSEYSPDTSQRSSVSMGPAAQQALKAPTGQVQGRTPSFASLDDL